MAERWIFDVVRPGAEFICSCGVWVGGGYALEQTDGLALLRHFCLACAERRVREQARAKLASEDPVAAINDAQMRALCGDAPPMDPRRAFGKRLRHEREQADLTMGDLARLLSWSVSAVSDLELGRACELPVDKLNIILGALADRGASDEACGELFRWWRASL